MQLSVLQKTVGVLFACFYGTYKNGISQWKVNERDCSSLPDTTRC